MAAIKISLDLDTRKFADFNGNTIQAFTWKKGTVVDFQLAITQNGVGVNLPSGSAVEAAIKKTSDLAGTYLFHTDAVLSGWGSGSKWFFRLDLTAPAFEDPTVLGKTLDFEVLLTFPEADGQRIASLAVGFTVGKNVIT